MTKQIQIRRGTAAQHQEFTGAIGEITMDTTTNTLRVHDGATVGGTVLARQSEIPSNSIIAGLSMPSTKGDVIQMFPDTLEVGQNYEFIAPCDGYGFFGSPEASNVFLYISSRTHGYTIGGLVVGSGSGGVIRGQLVIPAGGRVTAAVYSVNNTSFTSSFIPAAGA